MLNLVLNLARRQKAPAFSPRKRAMAGTWFGRPDADAAPATSVVENPDLPAAAPADAPAEVVAPPLEQMRARIDDGLLLVFGPEGDPVPPSAFAAAAAARPDALISLSDGETAPASRIAAVLGAQILGRLGATDRRTDWIRAMLRDGGRPQPASQTAAGQEALAVTETRRAAAGGAAFGRAGTGAAPDGPAPPAGVAGPPASHRDAHTNEPAAEDLAGPNGVVPSHEEAPIRQPAEDSAPSEQQASPRDEAADIWTSEGLAMLDEALPPQGSASIPLPAEDFAVLDEPLPPQGSASIESPAEDFAAADEPLPQQETAGSEPPVEDLPRLESERDASVSPDDANGQLDASADDARCDDTPVADAPGCRTTPVADGLSCAGLSVANGSGPGEALPPEPGAAKAGLAENSADGAAGNPADARPPDDPSDHAPAASADVAAEAAGGREIDPDSIVLVVIRGVPEGAVLSSGTRNGDGSWSISPLDLATATISFGQGSAEQGDARGAEGDLEITGIAFGEDGELVTISETVPLADYLAAPDSGEPAPLRHDAEPAGDDPVDEPRRVPLDVDGHARSGEAFDALVIRGVPAGARLSAGLYDAAIDGWVLRPQDLGGLAILPPADLRGDLTLTLMGIALRPGGGDAARVLGRLSASLA